MNTTIRIKLNKLLNNPFRKGAIAFCHNMVMQGYSDHIPIEINFINDQYKAISWNMFADTDLWNNYRNVSGIAIIEKLLAN